MGSDIKGREELELARIGDQLMRKEKIGVPEMDWVKVPKLPKSAIKKKATSFLSSLLPDVGVLTLIAFLGSLTLFIIAWFTFKFGCCRHRTTDF